MLETNFALEEAAKDCIKAFRNSREGHNATYIPALGQVDPELFSVAICTTTGELIGAGDYDAIFSIQSVAKPFLYSFALKAFGEDLLLSKVGVEPAAYDFNSVVQLDTTSCRPHNPMLNAGAIAIAGMIRQKESSTGEALEKIFAPFSMDGQSRIDQTIFESEVATGHRNFAIAHLLRYHGILEIDVEEALDLYFSSCSISSDIKNLATMAGTLANGGVNPITGQIAMDNSQTAKVLSVMSTCGLYNYSGEHAFFCGMPSKSGVSGAIIAVAPGKMGLAFYSPRVDERGNSIRGTRAIPYISEKLRLHQFLQFHDRKIDDTPDIEKFLEVRANKTTIQESKRSRNPTIQEELHSIIDQFKKKEYGKIPQYLEKLHESDPGSIAISICSTNGELFESGDTELSFTLQAGMNPVAFGEALEKVGLGRVLEVVGLEPTENSYSSIKVHPTTGLPYNPMSNAGALAIASIIPGSTCMERLSSLEKRLRLLTDAGHKSSASGDFSALDEQVLELERENSHRNIAICRLLSCFGVLGDFEQSLDLYLRQCSLRVDCRQVAILAATLANGGKNPFTGLAVFSAETTKSVLTVMYTCGLYEYSGRAAYRIGLPAKSGISGILYAVVPGLMGIAIYCPGVDDNGNSLRGLEILEHLANRYKLDIFSLA